MSFGLRFLSLSFDDWVGRANGVDEGSGAVWVNEEGWEGWDVGIVWVS